MKTCNAGVYQFFHILSFMHSSINSDTALLNSSVDASSCMHLLLVDRDLRRKKEVVYDYSKSTTGHCIKHNNKQQTNLSYCTSGNVHLGIIKICCYSHARITGEKRIMI